MEQLKENLLKDKIKELCLKQNKTEISLKDFFAEILNKEELLYFCNDTMNKLIDYNRIFIKNSTQKFNEVDRFEIYSKYGSLKVRNYIYKF